MFTFEAHPQGMNTFCMTFVPNERPLLATAGNEGVLVWDLSTRRPIRRLDIAGPDPSALTCSPDGRLLAVCEDESPNRIRLWDWAAERVEKEINGGEKVQCAVFSPAGDVLAIGGYRLDRDWDIDYRIRRLRTATWRPQRLLEGHIGQTGFLDFSPDGKLLASGAADRQAILWDLARQEPLLAVQHQKVVWGVAFSPDGSLLATTGGKTIKLIDVAARKVLRGQLRGHTKDVYGIAFTPDGRALASVSGDGTVRLWDVPTRQALRVFDWGLGKLHCIGFSADGMLAVAGSADGRVVVWDMD